MPQFAISRRRLFASSFAALAALGLVKFARAADAAKLSLHDAEILNRLLASTQARAAAYGIGAESGLLKQPGLNMALLFQSQAKAHADTLIALIKAAGGTPVAAKINADYVNDFHTASFKAQEDFLDLFAHLESTGINEMLAALPGFEDRDLTKTVGRIIADGVMHWTSLVSVLQKPLPANALSFGA